ncbi:MAG: tRNA (adenosine(37)-N6)-threonylcarbamoyltransferase complex dimerization subunit type 1 TsaB [bacterium]
MLVLTIDTSSTTSSLGIVHSNKLIGEIKIDALKNKHSERLIESIDWLLLNLNLKLKDIELLAVVIGPGSFTALRVGLSTAKGLSFAMGIPIAGINTLDALVYPYRIWDLPVVPLVPAKKDLFYSSIYRDNLPIFPPVALTYEELSKELVRLNRFILVGPGAKSLSEIFIRDFHKSVLIPDGGEYILPVALAELGRTKFEREGKDNIYNLEPVYIKGADIKLKGFTK